MHEPSDVVIILHSPLADSIGPDEEDVLVQAHALAESLRRLGWEPMIVPFDVDLHHTKTLLQHAHPRFVVNLVETLWGTGRCSYLAPMLLDSLAIPYTGSSPEALFLTSHKMLAKQYLSRAGLPTPPAIAESSEIPRTLIPSPMIVKPLWEDGSVCISQESVIWITSEEDALCAIQKGRTLCRCDVFLEQFIEGREFNLSLIGDSYHPEVLPIAEIIFTESYPGIFPILDYDAKWHPSSPAYRSTVRSFATINGTHGLAHSLEHLARACWKVFGLRGYARVDFRVDPEGKPWIIEINANPCIAPDGGFMASAREAGLTMDDVVARIIPWESFPHET